MAPAVLAVWNHRQASQRLQAQRVALLVAQAELALRQLQLEQHRRAPPSVSALPRPVRWPGHPEVT